MQTIQIQSDLSATAKDMALSKATNFTKEESFQRSLSIDKKYLDDKEEGEPAEDEKSPNFGCSISEINI